MSLKTRLRIAVSLLMAATVVALSLLYAHGFLSNEFDRTVSITNSITGQVQAAVIARLEGGTATEATPELTKQHLLDGIRRHSDIKNVLQRALENWDSILEIYVAGPDSKVLASTNPARLDQVPPPLTDVDVWANRSPFLTAEAVYFGTSNVESVKSLSVLGENVPFLTTHVVLSLPVVRNHLLVPLRNLAAMFAISLVISVLLALILPGLILDPLERVSQRLDLMAHGTYPESTAPAREAKELAAVYNKLDVLGQQFQGARANADDLRTNVEHLLERLEQAVLFVDPSGRLMMAGRNVGPLLGCDSEDLSGRLLSEVIPPETELGAILHSAIATGEPVQDRVVSLLGRDGERKLAVTCEPLVRNSSGAGRSIGMLVTMRDTETRGRIEAELGLAERLVALSRLTRGVAHEIKNPLNAITLHLEVLRNRLEEYSPEVDIIGREISRLDRVVKTFLDFNRPVEPRMGPVDLSELIQDLARLIAPQAAERSVRVQLEVPPAIQITGDRDLLKQAVLNVVMNAIEAMAANGGSLVLAVTRSRGWCQLAISDTGPGIAAEVQDRIFSLYFSTKIKGSGIGLAMAYRFVQLHDGKLEFSSELGKGTTFRFSFPEAVSTFSPKLASHSHVA